MTDNISLNPTINQINVTQQVNTVAISSPGPQGPVGSADPSSSVAYAVISASSIYSSSAVYAQNAVTASQGLYGWINSVSSVATTASQNALNASAGLYSLINTTSAGLYSYTNSASLNAYNQANAFTTSASSGLYSLIISASNGIITTGSVQYSTSAGNAITSSSAIISSSANISASAIISASSLFSSSVINGLVTTSSITNSFINVASVQPTQEGSIFYDSTVHHALNVVTDTATPQELGQQVLARVVNGASDNTTLTKGTIVYLSGATGNRPRVDRAKADSISTHDVLGIVYDDIAINAEGFVLTFGVIDNVNTNNATYTAGDTLYLSATIAGAYTNVAPNYPNYKVELGRVARANVNNGRILFYVNPAYNANTASGNMLLSDGYRAIGSSSARLDYYGNASFTGNVVVGGLVKGLDGLTTTNSASIGANLYVAGNIIGTTASSTISSSALFASSALYAVNSSSAYSGSALYANNSGALGGVVSSSYALLNSPTFVGTPTAPTAASGTNTTQLATTQFVRTEIAGLVNSAPASLDTLKELADAIGDDPNYATTVINNISTASLNAYNAAVVYANSASSNAYAQASAFTTTASNGLFNYSNSASLNAYNQAVSYANSASLNAYNAASNFTQNASAGLYNFIVSASQGIITAGSVQYAASSGYSPLPANASFTNVVINTSSTTTGLIVSAASGQNVNVMEVRNQSNATTVEFKAIGDTYFTPKGALYVANNIYLGYGYGTSGLNDKFGINTGGSSNIGLTIKGASNQAADLIQWLNSSGSIMSTINASGQLIVGSSQPIVSTSAAMVSVYTTASTIPGIIVKGSSTQSANLQEWKTSVGNTIAAISPYSEFTITGNIYIGGATNYGRFNVLTPANVIGGVIRGSSGQTSDLMQMQNSSGSVLYSVGALGGLILSPTSGIATIINAASTSTALQIKPNAANVLTVQNEAGTAVTAFIDRYGNVGLGGITTPYNNAALSIYTGGSTFPALIIRGAPSQSFDLQQWQNSSGSVISTINASGQFIVGGNSALINPNASTNGQASAMLSVIQTSSLNPGIIVRGVVNAYTSASHANMIEFQTINGAPQFGVNHLGYGFGNMSGDKFFYDRTYFRSTSTSQTPLFIQTLNNQSVDMTQWINQNTSQIYATVNSLGQFVIGSSVALVSTSAAMLSIYNSSSNIPGLIIRSASLNANNMQIWQDASGAAQSYIDTTGFLFTTVAKVGINNNYGAHINITPTNIGNKGIVVKGQSGQTANLSEWQDSSASVLVGITASGALSISPSNTGASGIILSHSVDGTGFNRALSVVTGGGERLFIDGYGYLTTNRSVTIGNSQSNTSAVLSVTNSGSAAKALVVKSAANQTANIQDWQNSSGSILSTINASGQFVIGGSVALVSTSAAMLSIYNSSSNNPGLIIKSASLQSAVPLQEWQDSTGTRQAYINSSGDFYTTGGRIFRGSTDLSSQINVSIASNSQRGITIRGNATQSANLQEWQTNAGASAVAIDPFGNITASGNVVYNQATNAQTAASYTLVLSDSGKFVEMNNASANYLIVPSNANAGFAVGARIDIIQTGAGMTLVSASSGVTLNFYSPTGGTGTASVAGQWAGLTLVKRATDTWAAIGNIK